MLASLGSFATFWSRSSIVEDRVVILQKRRGVIWHVHCDTSETKLAAGWNKEVALNCGRWKLERYHVLSDLEADKLVGTAIEEMAGTSAKVESGR